MHMQLPNYAECSACTTTADYWLVYLASGTWGIVGGWPTIQRIDVAIAEAQRQNVMATSSFSDETITKCPSDAINCKRPPPACYSSNGITYYSPTSKRENRKRCDKNCQTEYQDRLRCVNSPSPHPFLCPGVPMALWWGYADTEATLCRRSVGFVTAFLLWRGIVTILFLRLHNL